MRSQAIRNAHPEVVSINAGTTAWDKDGNVITLDEDKIKIEFDKLKIGKSTKAFSNKIAQCSHFLTTRCLLFQNIRPGVPFLSVLHCDRTHPEQTALHFEPWQCAGEKPCAGARVNTQPSFHRG